MKKSHVIDYDILGDDLQIVEIELDPGETVIAEAGAMNYMDDDISFEAKMGDGSNPTMKVFLINSSMSANGPSLVNLFL